MTRLIFLFISKLLQSESRILLGKLVTKYPPEIEASVLQKILRGHWKHYLLERPSLELCKTLVMLRDYNISGRVNLMEIPLLLHLLQFWRVSDCNKSFWCSGRLAELTVMGPGCWVLPSWRQRMKQSRELYH